ncbi:hypothetical protein C8R46DRAFT_1037883 [Mycena filopes]|nr:hypothetical protein C8R46DRAFT_1037883 [Mycena filopes]
MPGLRTMCAKPREKETARIERCALSPEGKRGAAHIGTCVLISEREAARSTRIKKCTRCEAARQQQEMYAVQREGVRERRERPALDAHIKGCTRREERERERLRAMHTSRDVRGARLREQRHDVRIERYAQSHPARMRERLRATHTSRDVRDARLREQRHDVRIERYAQFTPSERERGCARRTHREMYAMRGCESSGMMCASRDPRSSHPAREREAAKAAARERRERERERWAEQVEVMHASRLDERDARRERYRPRCSGPERRGEARCAGTRTAPRRGKKNSSRDTISEDCVVSAHKGSTVESCEYSPTPGKPLKGVGQRRPRIVRDGST